ncbi:MAG TPA: exodeoxyribonuclease VII large subunit [Bacteroidales bacterium]|nr:exodeoxyribonuclease VII large subunit [Bacteroidales bacterium]
MDSNAIRLYQLNKSIKASTKKAFPDYYWVIAEILEIRQNRSGHCYLELIEKSEKNDKIIAKSRATIWASRYLQIKAFFETTTGKPLQQGIKVMLRAEVNFHELYGLSLNIIDIDPAFTMGDLEMRKRKVLNKLEAEGIIEMNREIPIPEIPQRIAIVSAETAAGYGDFMDSILNNPYQLNFQITFFPAIMQGEAAAPSIINALEKIFKLEKQFDVVILIRGGGSQADLDCFNSYELALNIAQFPLPVFTGIGHERDETIADIVANQSLKTPTAVAEFLVDKLAGFLTYIEQIGTRLDHLVKWIIQEEKTILDQKAAEIKHFSQRFLNREEMQLENLKEKGKSVVINHTKYEYTSLKNYNEKVKYLAKNNIEQQHKRNIELKSRYKRSVKEELRRQQDKIRQFERSHELLKPERVLQRGYSITYKDGKALKNIRSLKTGDILQTRLDQGVVISRVENTKQEKT